MGMNDLLRNYHLPLLVYAPSVIFPMATIQLLADLNQQIRVAVKTDEKRPRWAVYEREVAEILVSTPILLKPGPAC